MGDYKLNKLNIRVLNLTTECHTYVSIKVVQNGPTKDLFDVEKFEGDQYILQMLRDIGVIVNNTRLKD